MPIPLAALAAALGGCSDDAPPPQTAAAGLPTELDLPYRYNQDCRCVREGRCVTLEELPGAFEVRNLSCRWQRPSEVAQCDFEQRFVNYRYAADGNYTEDPEAWGRRSLRAMRLPNGGWCALG